MSVTLTDNIQLAAIKREHISSTNALSLIQGLNSTVDERI